MRSLRLFAVVLAAASSGCAGSRLFSTADARDDVEVPALDPSSAEEGAAENTDGPWQVASDAGNAADSGIRDVVRPAATLPVSELLGRAEQLRAEQRLPEAREYLDAIIRQQPTHPRAHHLLAVIADLEGRFGDAEHHYQAALQSDRNNATVIGDLGYSYLLQGRLPLAEQNLLRARALDPSYTNAAQNLALLYSRRGDLASAHRALSEVLPPAEVNHRLAQLFPGVPVESVNFAAAPPAMPTPHAAQPAAPATHVSGFASNGTPAVGANSSPPTAPPQYQSSKLIPPEFASSMPNAAPTGAQYPDGRMVVVDPYGRPVQNAVAATGIVQTSGAAGPPTASTAESLPQSLRAPPGTRQWPPAIWPPVAPVESPSPSPAAAATPPSRPTSGVTYLMQRRLPPPAHPSQHPYGQGGLPAPSPAMEPYGIPPASQQPPAAHDPQAQYTTGPGSSRIVTWSNLNGQSVDVPPLPPTDDELQAAAAMGLSTGTSQPYPIAQRSSPGSASGWNGGMYPTPQRQLPGDAPTIYDYPPQGAPVHAAVPPHTAAAATPQANVPQFPSSPPHPGFRLAPTTDTPHNPLAAYEADRRQLDQRFQQQVDQTYARSPAGHIQPPSSAMTIPTYQVPTYQSHTNGAAPMSPGGTPWPSRPAESSAGTATPIGNTSAATGAHAPPRYRESSSNRPTTTPAYNPGPARPWDTGYSGPTITPAPAW